MFYWIFTNFLFGFIYGWLLNDLHIFIEVFLVNSFIFVFGHEKFDKKNLVQTI